MKNFIIHSFIHFVEQNHLFMNPFLTKDLTESTIKLSLHKLTRSI